MLEGVLRGPSVPSLPAEVFVPRGSAKPAVGAWQLAHAWLPFFERRASK
jgi:hypothetical protein